MCCGRSIFRGWHGICLRKLGSLQVQVLCFNAELNILVSGTRILSPNQKSAAWLVTCMTNYCGPVGLGSISNQSSEIFSWLCQKWGWTHETSTSQRQRQTELERPRSDTMAWDCFASTPLYASHCVVHRISSTVNWLIIRLFAEAVSTAKVA